MTKHYASYHERPDHLLYRRRPFYVASRRLLDVGVAALALVASSPILAVAAIAIKLDDGGPVFFRQQRVGRMGRLFTLYKLRTMRLDKCEDALSPTKSGDPRITRVGALLRKASVDELPQFVNVLRGDMAVVGPRPEMPFVVRKYEAWQHLRQLATPGVTGLWQVTCRSDVALHEARATALDLHYIAHSSTILDFRIILRTFTAIFSAQGAF